MVTERRCFDYFNVNILLVYCTTILQAIAIGFPAASGGKEPAVIWETWVQSLGWEDPLEKRLPTPVQNSMDCIVHGVTKSGT